MERRRLPLVAVGGHLLLTALHGVVHAAVPAYPDGGNATVAAVVLYLLPVLGLGLVVGGYRRVGSSILLGAGLAGFAFEGVFHFVFANPDHVARVTDHHAAFGLTAVLTTAGNLLLVGAAVLVGAARIGVPVTRHRGRP